MTNVNRAANALSETFSEPDATLTFEYRLFFWMYQKLTWIRLTAISALNRGR